MKKSLIVCFIFLFFLLGSVNAQNFYGFGALKIPTDNTEAYTFKWARVGMTVDRRGKQFVAEFDVMSSEVQYFYLRLHKNLLGGEISVLAGKFLNPVPYLYPGPKTVQTPRWAKTLDGFGIYSTGTAIWYKSGQITLRAAHYNGNGAAATISYGLFSWFWERNVGQGIAITPFKSRFLTPWLGLTKYQDETITASIQNYVQLAPWLRFYSLVDLVQDQLPVFMTGVSIQYAKNSFLKIFKDEERFLAEITFSFE